MTRTTKGEATTNWSPLLPKQGKRRRPHGIYSEQELKSLILYEKRRADRDNSSLALVVIHTGSLNGSNLEQLVEGLLYRLRTTDHIGWFAQTKIGVLLPNTDWHGARVFTELLHGLRVFKSIGYQIKVYPDAWHENGEDDREAKNRDSRNGTSTVDSSQAADSVLSPTQHARLFTSGVPVWKRVIDIPGAIVALLLSAPVLMLVAMYIKIVSPGPVFFRQQRVGLGRKQFELLKLRTMRVSNNEDVHAEHAIRFIKGGQKMHKLDGRDPRIIPGGRIVRALCIDELPQLWNVLRGEMSLVGPRPCIPYEADEYLRWHAARFSTLPGLTGLWQVSGKNRLTFQQMIVLDIAYERKMSIWRDIRILSRTIPAIIDYAAEPLLARLRRRLPKQEPVSTGHSESDSNSFSDYSRISL